jgi:hypothetical protein
MLPSEATAESFAGYPPQGHAFAVQHLAVIRKLPVAFAALLMREVIIYDWQFPAERKDLDDQFAYLESLSPADFERSMNGFVLPSLSPALNEVDWIRRPGEFVEALTAELWSGHQIDAFRTTADAYAQAWRKAFPEAEPAAPRLAVVVFGRDLRDETYTLFRKLGAHGVRIPQVDPEGAWKAILDAVAARAQKYPVPYGHWYIDGGSPPAAPDARLTMVTWAELASVRSAMLSRMQSVIGSGHGGPEELRTMMAETTLKQVGMSADGQDEILSRFQLSVLAEGSGTQIFSTTFVQWTAREALRRAQPCTLLLRYAPRQRQLPMNELLSGTGDRNAPDPEGSLIDADMGAYYTWIDQRRLTGADQASLIAWSEAHGHAIVAGPTAPRGTTVDNAMTMRQIFEQFV